jgi:hypothetical protein
MNRLLDYSLGSLSNIIMMSDLSMCSVDKAIELYEKGDGESRIYSSGLGNSRAAGRGGRVCSRDHLQVPARCYGPSLHQIMHVECIIWFSRFGHLAIIVKSKMKVGTPNQHGRSGRKRIAVGVHSMYCVRYDTDKKMYPTYTI